MFACWLSRPVPFFKLFSCLLLLLLLHFFALLVFVVMSSTMCVCVCVSLSYCHWEFVCCDMAFPLHWCLGRWFSFDLILFGWKISHPELNCWPELEIVVFYRSMRRVRSHPMTYHRIVLCFGNKCSSSIFWTKCRLFPRLILIIVMNVAHQTHSAWWMNGTRKYF